MTRVRTHLVRLLFGVAVVLSAGPAASSETGRAELEAVVAAFHQGRDQEGVWTDAGAGPVLNGRGRAVLRALQDAGRDGLVADDYRLPPAADRAALDRALSLELLRYLTDLRAGRLASQEAGPDLHLDRYRVDGRQLLARVAGAEDPAREIAQAAPSNPVYRRLRRLLAEYRDRAAWGGWPAVAAGDALKPGMRDPRVSAVRRRLIAESSVSLQSEDPDLYDEGLVLEVQAFQRRHGLDADGVIGNLTLGALNVPIEDRIRQILLNMERFRWMPDEFGEDHVLVNLAAFTLDYVRHGTVTMSMRVVVGRRYRQTPVFNDRIRYLEFNPTWTVPLTIAIEDLLPKIRRSPSYLPTAGIDVFAAGTGGTEPIDPATIDWSRVGKGRFPFTLRQRPSRQNALGKVKFMFPNRYDVYLHDSPARDLFRRSVRAFSSGCIRLQKPLALAEALLAADGQDPGRVATILASSESTRVVLATPVPVLLTYLTAWVGEGGTPEFRDDVYGRDASLAKALGLGVSSSR